MILAIVSSIIAIAASIFAAAASFLAAFASDFAIATLSLAIAASAFAVSCSNVWRDGRFVCSRSGECPDVMVVSVIAGVVALVDCT